MKRLILYFLFLWMGSYVFGQYADLVLPVNEVSFTFFSLKNMKIADGGQNYHPYFFQGVSYKRKLGTNIIRSNFSYFQKLEKVESPDNPSWGNYAEMEFGAGYQRNFGEYWIQPYVAGDFSVLSSKLLKENGGGLFNFYKKVDTHSFGLGLTPSLGLKFKTFGPLSFSLETEFEFLVIWEKGSSFYWTPDIVPIYNDVNLRKYIITWNPVGSLNISLEF